MKILTDNIDTEKILNESFNRIISRCDDDLANQINNFQLIITDEIKANALFKDDVNFRVIKKTYENGFGGVVGNRHVENSLVHVVVLNLSKIHELSLSDGEIDGVLSHELGHIFNEYPPMELPSVSDDFCKFLKDGESVKAMNLKNNEFYADYFSKTTNSFNGLIGSIEKYTTSDSAVNKELFTQRLEELRGTVKYIGRIKEFRTKT